jgi:hypothetical protein
MATRRASLARKDRAALRLKEDSIMNSSASPTEAWLVWQRNRSPDWRDFKAGPGSSESPFPTPFGVSGPLQAFLTLLQRAKVRASQLRGSGGVSPRFPNIPLRNMKQPCVAIDGSNAGTAASV